MRGVGYNMEGAGFKSLFKPYITNASSLMQSPIIWEKSSLALDDHIPVFVSTYPC